MRSVSLFLPPGLRSSVSRSPHGSEQQADDPPQEHTHAWSGLPRVFVRALASKHANAWWSLQLHTLCALHTASRRPALASCAATVRPVYVQVQEGRLVQLGSLAAAVLEGDVWCSTRPDLSIRPQPSEQQPAQMQEHARHARRGEDARPGGCSGSRTRVRPGHRPLLTRMHLFPLRLSAAAHIASRIYPRSRGALER